MCNFNRYRKWFVVATAKRHPAGTTDRLLEADRERPY